MSSIGRGRSAPLASALICAIALAVGIPAHLPEVLVNESRDTNASPASLSLTDPCTAPAPNPIACENSLPGNPPSEWDVAGAGSESIQGFAASISVNRGQTVRFKIDTLAIAYRLDIYRLGYYGGNGARKVATVNPSAILPQPQPTCTTEASTGLVDCGVWNESASWLVPAAAVSGVYIAKLIRTDGTAGESHVIFVVRDDDRQADLLFQTSDTTWQAYNDYGGHSLYAGDGPSGRAYKVSYNRPFRTRATSPGNWVFHAEYPMIRWLEANGYDVSYTTGVDTDRRGAELLEHKAFLSVGHDQYWSAGERANVEAARAAGVNLAFFSDKTAFWKMRWEPSIDGSAIPYRTLVSYKETLANDKIDPLSDVWTGTWRDPRFSPPADGGRPENQLTGTLFAVKAAEPSTIDVPSEFGRLRFWRNTTVAQLQPGETATLPMGTLGDDWDEAPQDYSSPSGLLALSHTRRTVSSRLLDYGSSFGAGTATHSLTLYRDSASRALVFGAGTGRWTWGLDTWHDGNPSTTDLRMQQATLNLLADMGSQPATPRADLVTSTPAADDTPPVSTIQSPTSGAVLQRGSPVVVQGMAFDADGSVARVEVSTDSGVTWNAAAGTTNWSFEWTPTTAGPAVLVSRAFDDNANVEAPGAGVPVTVVAPADGTCPCSIWSAATIPSIADSGPDRPVELGVKFRSSVGGYITAIRYYKSAANTGTHRGSLWTSTGTRLAAVTFVGESASGWQTATFESPVPIEPNTTYIASYYATAGHYAFSASYFVGTGVDNGPLHALASVNGVYQYGSTSAFPNSSYRAANYWVDLLFDTTAADTVGPKVLGTNPSAGAVVAPTAQITVTFDEAVDGSSVSGATFELRDSANHVVPSSISHEPGSRRAVLTPSASLESLRTYSGHLRGGAGGVQDLRGNPLSTDYSWTFATGVPPAAQPDAGPGGPILVVGSTANPFSLYYAEMLRAEGLNAFAVMDISQVTSANLAGYDVVVLGNIPLTSSQVTMFTDWVNGGGHLLAMRPDKQLASLLGLTDTAGSLRDQYLLIDTATAPGAGLVGQTIQFHGEADLYDIAGASRVAALYSSATLSTSNPAVTLRQVGVHGGQAAAFTYDLARSVVYTRQGNPAWAGQERDGTSPIRATELFWGGGDRDWIDLAKVAIPQADEQQRLFANLILQMNLARRPLPRFWYLPRGSKAAVVMTGDEHGTGGTVDRFGSFLASSAAGCSVDDWECVRATSYIYPSTRLSAEDAGALDQLGFEIGLHTTTGCADFTAASLDTSFSSQIAQWRSNYPAIPRPSTVRTHCIPWSDWSSHVSTSARHGIRLDTDYYYWPGTWAASLPGLFTGSGLPMRFATQTGAILDVYQAPTQITDESGQFIPGTISALLNRALGPQGFYGVFTANIHNDLAFSPDATAIVAAARTRGVPVVSARQMLEWLDGRNASTYRDLSWDGEILSFRIELGAGARGLQAMVPRLVDGMHVISVAADGTAVNFTEDTIKGIAYAKFLASSSAYRVTYAAPDRLRGTVTAAGTSAGLGNVAVSVHDLNGAQVRSAVTDGLGTYEATGLAPGTYYVRTSNQQSYGDQVFSGIACRAGCVVTAGTPLEVTGTGSVQPVHFTLALNHPPVLVNPGNRTNGDNDGYSPEVLTDAPVAYWRLGEVTGTSAADTAGTSPGTLFGGITLGQAGALADGNPAMLFNGSTGYVRAANPAVSLAGDLTIELWLNVSLVARQTLISKSHLYEFELTLEPWGQLNFYQGNGTTYEEIPLAFAGITANSWQHVVVTRTAATKTIRLYVNGVAKGSRTYTTVAAPGTRPVSIGRSDAGSKYVNGRLDEVALYPTALGAVQIATHYGLRTSAGTATVIALQLMASDPDVDALTYGATGLPSGLTVNAATGLISGTLSLASVGTHQVTAAASDGILSHSQGFTWTVTHVNRRPTLSSPGNQTSEESASIALPLLASDTDGDALTYSASGLPASLTINPATGLISGVLPYTSAGAYTVTAAVSDGPLSSTQTFTWTVANRNGPPVLANPGSQTHWDITGYPQAVLAEAPVGYWRFAEITGTSADDSAGDNSGTLFGGITLGQAGALADGNPAMLLNGSTGYVRVPNPAVSLAGDLTIELWLNVSLTGRQTLISKNNRYEFELTLEPWGQLNFYQGNGTTYEEIPLAFAGITANTWQHVVVTRVSATKTIRLYVNGIAKGSRTYTTEVAVGTRPVSIGRSDAGFKYVTGRLDEVALYPTALGAVQIATHYGLRTSASTATVVALPLVASDPDGDALTYSATGLPAGLTVNATTGLISGTLSLASAGTHQVTATASDGNLSQSQTFAWTVLRMNRAPLLASPGSQTSVENASIALQLAASDQEGDALTYSATGLPASLTLNPATGLIAGTLSFTSAGTHTVTATVSDGSLSSSQTFTWTIANTNRAPVLPNPGTQTHWDITGYVPGVLVDAPVGYWRLGETTGTSAADATGTNPGTLFGGVTLGQAGALADGNPAMLFNGSTGYVRVANPGVSLAGDLTIELWLNVSLATRQTLISKSNLYEFELTLETWGQLNLYQGTGTTYEEIPLAFAGITANSWQHVVVTRTAATKTIRLYVNGVAKGSRTYTTSVASGPRAVSIGRSDVGTRCVTGRLDEVALYPSALSAAQIATHYGLRTSPGNPTVVALQLAASDPDGEGLTYSATGLPAGLTVDATTGLISGTLSPASVGTYQVTATASDGSLSASNTFTWTIAGAGPPP